MEYRSKCICDIQVNSGHSGDKDYAYRTTSPTLTEPV
jgi:hypothetical protein